MHLDALKLDKTECEHESIHSLIGTMRWTLTGLYQGHRENRKYHSEEFRYQAL